MKKMAWITGALVFLMVMLAALGAVCHAVSAIALDENFYSGQSRAAVMQMLDAVDAPDVSAQVTAYIGLDSEQQDAFAREVVAFMAGETDAQPDVLSDKERQHMLDVRTIVGAITRMGKAYLAIAAALAVAAAWTGARLKGPKAQIAGTLTAVSLIMLIVMNMVNEITAGGFETMFVQMHEALFANDLWLLDPATDILIRMMPQGLFEQALLDGANMALRTLLIIWAMLTAVQWIVGNMIRRHMAKGE